MPVVGGGVSSAVWRGTKLDLQAISFVGFEGCESHRGVNEAGEWVFAHFPAGLSSQRLEAYLSVIARISDETDLAIKEGRDGTFILASL